MDSSDLVALIALLVSLIALLIALIQLLQSSALTADGWRRCNATNIGQWSVFSRRHWLWSELRNEVQFTIPLVTLMNTSDLYGESSQGSYKLATKTYVKHDMENVDFRTKKLIFDEGTGFRRPESKLVLAAYHLLGFGTLPNDIEARWILTRESPPASQSFRKSLVFGIQGFCLSSWRWMQGYHFRHWTPEFLPQARDFDTVTWDILLCELCRLQHESIQHRPADSIEHLRPALQPFSSGHGHSSSHNYRPDSIKRQMRNGETVLCLSLKRFSWDSMPNDVVRPLARSTLSDIVILARRLGMEWKSFNLSSESYRAEGPASTLTATRLQGLGLVFRFDKTADLDKALPLCTENADMAYFGILPGEERLGIENYSLVQDDRKLDLDRYIKSELGEQAKSLRDLLWFWSRVIPNDAVAILSPFLPLRKTPTPKIYTTMGTKNRAEIYAKLSIFKAFGLERKFRDELNQRLAAITPRLSQTGETFSLQDPFIPAFGADTGLKYLFDHHLQIRLKPHYHVAKIIDSSKAPGYNWEHSADFVDNLRNIHELTTSYFAMLVSSDVSNDLKKPTQITVQFTHVVKAYMTHVSQIIIEWDKEKFGRKRRKPEDHGGSGLGNTGWAKFVEICDRLVKNIDIFYVVFRDFSPSYESIPESVLNEFWWMLVARGVAWQFSVNVARANAFTMVPSSIYGSKMPVWIE